MFVFYRRQKLEFPQEHVLLARLVPRCSDPCIEVRQMSMDCIQATLLIAQRCEGTGPLFLVFWDQNKAPFPSPKSFPPIFDKNSKQ